MPHFEIKNASPSAVVSTSRILFPILILTICSVVASQPTLTNGDFETNSEGQPAGWKATGPGARVTPFRMAMWSRQRLTFNSAEFSKVRLWLGVAAGGGSVWFDNVRIEESEFSTQLINNPSFEDGDAQSVSGWLQNPPNGAARDPSTYERFPGQPEGKGASVRVTARDGKPSRVGQDIRIIGRKETNRDFVLSFDCRSENPQSPMLVEVFGIEADGRLGRQLPTSPFPSRFALDRFGSNILRLASEAQSPSAVSQEVTLSADEQRLPWRVSAFVRLQHLEHGSLSLSVRTGPESNSEAVVQLSKANDAWQEVSVNFIPGAAPPQIEIRLQGDKGLAFVDNLLLGPAKLNPRPKQLEWLPVNESFAIQKQLTVQVKGDGGPIVASAIRLFSESFKTKTATEVQWGHSSQPVKADLTLAISGSRSGAVAGPDSYSLRVGSDGVFIESAEPRGILDGLMTLLQIIQQTPAGTNVFLATKIIDAPDLPFRGEYWAGNGPGQGDYRELMDRLARLRYNAVCIENYPYFSLDNPESRRVTEEIFNYARHLGIEPVPTLQSFGHAYQVNADPNIAEGQEVQNERLVLAGTNAVALAHPNVIRSETSNIRITDQNGTQSFLEGHDYNVLPGEIGWKDRNGFSSNAAPFKVQRAIGGRIQDGATVLASYDYVSMATGDGTQPAYCPNEPRVYRTMRDAIRNTIHILHPKYLHIGHDEIMQMGTDSRCRKSGRSNAENFAYKTWEMYRIAKAEDPKVRVMIWDDMVNPYTHGYFANYPYLENSLRSPFLQATQLLKDPTALASDLLPRDLAITIWLYGATDALTAGRKSLEWFGQRGYTIIGSPYASFDNARGWSIACRSARDEGLDCWGVLHTSWSENYTTLEESASTAWRTPSEP